MEPKQDELVNLWKPVTSEYADAVVPPAVIPLSPAPALPAKDRAPSGGVDPKAEKLKNAKLRRMHGIIATPYEIPAEHRHVENIRRTKEPLLVVLYTWYLFVQTGINLLGAWVLSTYPESLPSSLLTSFGGSLWFIRGNQFEPEIIRRLTTEYLCITALLSLIVGIMWLKRMWITRWATMFYAGGYVVKLGVYFFSDAVSGVHTPVSQGAIPVIYFSVVVNAFIFCYLAFWPGVKEVFEPDN